MRARQWPASLPLTAATVAGRATGAARRWSTPAARRTTSCTAPTPTQSGHPWVMHPRGGAPGSNRRPRGGRPLTPGVERAPAAGTPSTRHGQLQHGRDSARPLRAGGEAAPHRDARSRGGRQLGPVPAPSVNAPQRGRLRPETPISAAWWAPARARSGARGHTLCETCAPPTRATFLFMENRHAKFEPLLDAPAMFLDRIFLNALRGGGEGRGTCRGRARTPAADRAVAAPLSWPSCVGGLLLPRPLLRARHSLAARWCDHLALLA